jgi:tetratricopeptide (TPR) repeat protein
MEKNKNRSNLEDSQLERMLHAKFDQDKKEAWADKLANEYGIVRKNSGAAPHQSKVRTLFFRLSAVAAVLLLLLVAVPMLNTDKNSGAELADAYLSTEIYPAPADRKSAFDLTSQRSAASDAYKLGNYEEAIELWEKIIQKNPSEATIDRFYLGLSQLYSQQPDLAIDNLLKALPLSVEEERFTEEINWFLGLAYVKAEKTEEAKAQLESIRPEEWNYSLAQELLSDMN